MPRTLQLYQQIPAINVKIRRSAQSLFPLCFLNRQLKHFFRVIHLVFRRIQNKQLKVLFSSGWHCYSDAKNLLSEQWLISPIVTIVHNHLRKITEQKNKNCKRTLRFIECVTLKLKRLHREFITEPVKGNSVIITREV